MGNIPSLRKKRTTSFEDVGGAIVVRSITVLDEAPNRHNRHIIVPLSNTSEAVDLQKWKNTVKTHRFPMIIFLPINFFEQLLGPTNFYYFILGCIQLIRPISDTGGVPSNWVPVSFVIAVSMFKDGYEEWKRHVSDNNENHQKSTKLDHHGNWVEAPWKSLLPGDILLVRDEESFPADLIMLQSSDPFGICNVETCQLDGESNLKIKTCIPELANALFGGQSISVGESDSADERDDGKVRELGKELSRKKFEIYGGAPSTQLYQYTGMLAHYDAFSDHTPTGKELVSDKLSELIHAAEQCGASMFPLTVSQFLWRGASLRSTDYIIGMVAYTGQRTKLFMNNTSRKPKKTKLYRTVMSHIFVQGIMEASMCLLMAALSATTVPLVAKHWYLLLDADQGYSGYDISGVVTITSWVDYLKSFSATFFRMVLLLSYLIPVTLIVQIEISHWVQAMLMQLDTHMSSPVEKIEEDEDEDEEPIVDGSIAPIKKDQKSTRLIRNDGCIVNSVDILDDLGCITHIYSDKTGTLTQNLMEFKCLALQQPNGNVKEFGVPETGHITRRMNNNPDTVKPAVKIPYVDFDRSSIEINTNGDSDAALRDFLLCLSVCHSVVIKNKTARASFETLESVVPSTKGDPIFNALKLSHSEQQGTMSHQNLAHGTSSVKSHLNTSFRQRTPTNYSGTPLLSPNTDALAFNFDAEAEALIVTNPGMNRLLTVNSKRRNASMDFGDPASPAALSYAALEGCSSCLKGSLLYPLSRYRQACYDASSPDELALVCAAKYLGVEFCLRPSPDRITLGFRDEAIAKLFFSDADMNEFHQHESEVTKSHPQFMPYSTLSEVASHASKKTLSQKKVMMPSMSFRILDVLEFDNYRKKMSVVIRDQTGRIVIFTKGADSSMIASALESNDQGGDGVDLGSMNESILKMSKLGLRTLVFGKRVIPEEEYTNFANEMLQARRTQEADDDVAVQNLIGALESNLTILGCTGVNDRLQRHCASTITSIKSAGINLWVLTGDKVETAISIGMSTNLLSDRTYNCIIDGDNVKDVLKKMRTGLQYVLTARMMSGKPVKIGDKDNGGRSILPGVKGVMDLTKFTPETSAATRPGAMLIEGRFSDRELLNSLNEYLDDFEECCAPKDDLINGKEADSDSEPSIESGQDPNTNGPRDRAIKRSDSLITYDEIAVTITGGALEMILEHRAARTCFFALANLCSVVIACRVSPLQKALVVDLSSKYYSNIPDRSFCSLAIGDGANDVNMIMTASVGVGIRGKEGAQAARTADIAIKEFHHLRHLLLTHGHEAIRRNSFMIYHTLWKNTFFGSAAFFFAFTCLYSGVDIYNLWIKQLYNLVFTAVPIMYFCAFDRYLPHHIMAKYSELYPTYSRPDGGMYFGKKWYFWWMILGFCSSAVVTYFPLLIMNFGAGHDGIIYTSLDTYGQVVYTLTVLLGCVTVAPFVSCWSGFMIWTPIIAIFAYFLMWYGLANSINSDVVTSWSINRLFTYHAAIFCTIFCIIIPLLGWYLTRIIFRPSRQTIIQERLSLGVHDLVIGKVARPNMAFAPKQSKLGNNFVFAEGSGLNRLTMQQEVVHRRAGSLSASGSDSIAISHAMSTSPY